MNNHTITFFSCKGRGLEPNLKLAKDFLTARDAAAAFEYFNKNEATKNPFAVKGYRAAREQFFKQSSTVLSADNSLPFSASMLSAGQTSILLMEHYDYLFPDASSQDAALPKQLACFQNFTHILPGSPFGADLLKKYPALKKTQVLPARLPFDQALVSASENLAFRKKLEFYYPVIKDKKIISIILAGKTKKEDPNPFLDVDLRNILDTLGKDWFLLTNHMLLAESGAALDVSYHTRFGLIGKILPTQQLCGITDLMITNHSPYACHCAALGKPVYCLKYKDNGFETYMKQHYPKLYLSSPEQYLQRREDTALVALQKQFADYFSYSSDVPEGLSVLSDILQALNI